jgi:hypothetical protein
MAALEEKRHLFRMTHIKNIGHILRYGITHKDSAEANPNFEPIGDPSLISTRSNFVLQNGRRLGEYIPWYFSVRTPMLYVIQKGFNGVTATPAEDIVYCVSSVQRMVEIGLPFVFTSGHAVDTISEQYTSEDIGRLETVIDWDAVKETNWHKETDLDLKRRKQAEFLVLGDIPVGAILGFIVYNQSAKDTLRGLGIAEQQIHINTKYYF